MPEIAEFVFILVLFVALHFAYDVWLQPWWRRAFNR